MIDDDDDDWQEKPKYPEKTCPSATNPTWSDPSSNPGCRGGKPATNRLSYGMAGRRTLELSCLLTMERDTEFLTATRAGSDSLYIVQSYFGGHCGKSFGTRELCRCHGLQASWWNGLATLNSYVCISQAAETDYAASLWDDTSLCKVDDPLDGWLRSVDRRNKYSDRNLHFWDVHYPCTVSEHVH
jgi:hypothetical protein